MENQDGQNIILAWFRLNHFIMKFVAVKHLNTAENNPHSSNNALRIQEKPEIDFEICKNIQTSANFRNDQVMLPG